MGKKISNIPYSNIFTNMSPRAREIKERINKWDLIKIKSFYMAQENSIKVKRELTVWENIFANDTSDKGLISKIYKELTGLHSRKTNNPIAKWAKDLNRQFSKEDMQRVQRRMKRCSASVAIRGMPIKTTMTYTCRNGHHKQISKQQVLKRMWRKGHPSALLVGVETGAASVANSMEFPQETKNGTAF